MADTTPIPTAEITGLYGAMVKKMPRKMLGEMPEPVEVAWHAPANLMTGNNTALGVESQEFAAACGLQPLAVPSMA